MSRHARAVLDCGVFLSMDTTLGKPQIHAKLAGHDHAQHRDEDVPCGRDDFVHGRGGSYPGAWAILSDSHRGRFRRPQGQKEKAFGRVEKESFQF